MPPRAAGTATFTADGTMLAVGGGDHVIGVWDVATGDLRDTLRGHAAPVLSLTFAADGRTLYSVGGDNSVIAWDTEGDRSFAARASRAPTVPAAGTSYIGLTTIVWPLVGWSADRNRVYVGVPDGSGTAVIDVAAGVATRTPVPYQLDPAAAVPVVDFDRGVIFLTTIDGVLERRDLVSAGLLADSSAQPTPSRFGVAVSGDGRLVATAMTDPQKAHRVDLVDPKTLAVRNTIGPLDHFPFGLWLSADGSLLAAASGGPGHHVELWDTRTGKRRWITDVGVDQGLTFALSPDGRTLLVATLRGEAVALDLATGRIGARYEQQIASRIVSAEYAPDGTVVAVTGDDGQVRLLQAATLREIGTLPMPGADWANVAFQRDGRTMSAVDDRGRVVQWPASPTTWVERACGIVGRDLTRAEWAAYLPGQEYERTCTATTQSPPARP